MADFVRVEVAYGLPDRQVLLEVVLPAGATLIDAIEASQIRQKIADLEVDPKRVGIFGRKAGFDQILRDADRVEIYRPLVADPKEVRRARALEQKE